MGQTGRQGGSTDPPPHRAKTWQVVASREEPWELVLEEAEMEVSRGPCHFTAQALGVTFLSLWPDPCPPSPCAGTARHPCVLGNVVAGVFLAVPRVEAPTALEVSVCPQELFLFDGYFFLRCPQPVIIIVVGDICVYWLAGMY